jgi:hypothetical protein
MPQGNGTRRGRPPKPRRKPRKPKVKKPKY